MSTVSHCYLHCSNCNRSFRAVVPNAYGVAPCPSCHKSQTPERLSAAQEAVLTGTAVMAFHQLRDKTFNFIDQNKIFINTFHDILLSEKHLWYDVTSPKSMHLCYRTFAVRSADNRDNFLHHFTSLYEKALSK